MKIVPLTSDILTTEAYQVDTLLLSIERRREDGSKDGRAWIEMDGTLTLDGLTVEECARLFVNCTAETVKQQKEACGAWQRIELCSVATPLFILRALSGHYPADGPEAIFWETVRAMLREGEMFGERAE